MTSTHPAPSPGAGIAARYERFFVPAIGKPFARHLVDLASLARGERVLDVGCGTGVVARLAARRVGADGAVVGVDVNPDMLAEARAADDADGIEWRQADAQSLPFDDGSFDVVLCQLSLMFVDDRARALGEMRRVLVPGGRLLLNVPGPATPAFEELAEAMDRHIGAGAAGFVRRVFSIDDAAELRALLRDAGFREVAVSAGERRLELPPPDEFLRQYIESTPLAIEVAATDDQKRSALVREVVERWRRRAGDGAFEVAQPYLVARARS